jgi:uncharacterized protein YukE
LNSLRSVDLTSSDFGQGGNVSGLFSRPSGKIERLTSRTRAGQNARDAVKKRGRHLLRRMVAGPKPRPGAYGSNERNTMAQAIMSPEEVRRFADELRRFNAELQDRMVSLQARFAALGDTWQDQEHSKFAEEFSQTLKALKKFVEISNQHAPYLLRKAQRIEEYLSQR